MVLLQAQSPEKYGKPRGQSEELTEEDPFARTKSWITILTRLRLRPWGRLPAGFQPAGCGASGPALELGPFFYSRFGRRVGKGMVLLGHGIGRDAPHPHSEAVFPLRIFCVNQSDLPCQSVIS